MPERTPLYDWHVSHGGRMVDFAGWDMPVQYTSIVNEHQAVRTSAGLFDISHMGRLQLQGPDALTLLQRVYTNDAASLRIGQIRYGLICNESGGILDDVLVYRFEPFWLMVVNASNRPKIVDWLERQRTGLKVTIIDRTFDWGMIAIQGPRAVDVIGQDDPEAGKLKYYFGELASDPSSAAPTIVSRTGYTGEDGFEVIVPRARVVDQWTRWLTQASSLGIELKPCGLGARDTLRLEAAMPLYGHELGETIDPYQAGLGWAVKTSKQDLIGRSALLSRRQDSQAPVRVGLVLEGKRIAREGAQVLREGRRLGHVTSGTFSPTLNQAIAMSYVERAAAVPGTACEVDVRGKPVPAQVVGLPFYKRVVSSQ